MTFYMDDYYQHDRPVFQAFLNASNTDGAREIYADRDRSLTCKVDHGQTGIVWFKSDRFPLTFFYINTHNVPDKYRRWDFQYSVNDIESYFMVDGLEAESNSFMIYYDELAYGFNMKRIMTREDVPKRQVKSNSED